MNKLIFTVFLLSAAMSPELSKAEGTGGGCTCDASGNGGTATNPEYQQTCADCCAFEWDCQGNCSTLFGVPANCSEAAQRSK